MSQNTATKLSKAYVGEDRKEIEQDIEASSILKNSNYYINKKRKYPFYQHIDKPLDPQLKAIFADTFQYISNLVSGNGSKQNTIDEFKEIDVDDVDEDSLQIQDQINTDSVVIEDQEKDVNLYDQQIMKQELVIDHEENEKENENEDDFDNEDDMVLPVMPLTEAEIRKELKFSENIVNSSKSTLNSYQQKLIEIITKEFETINFRSPSQKEIAIILTKSLNKMKNRITPKYKQRRTKNQLLLAKIASGEGNSMDILMNSRRVVMDYLIKNMKQKEDKKLNSENIDFIHNVLMFKIRQNSAL